LALIPEDSLEYRIFSQGAIVEMSSVSVVHSRLRHLRCVGLGTGLGSALIVDNILEPMELGHLTYRKGRRYEDYMGLAGLKRLEEKKWRHQVKEVVRQLKAAMQADYVVLGGGNAKLLKRLPAGTRLGNNANSFQGGYRLWTQRYSGSAQKRFH
jgi:polyphosphate glucokinase